MKIGIRTTLVSLVLLCFGTQNHVGGQMSNPWMKKLQKISIFESHRKDVEKLFSPAKVVRTMDKAETEKNGWGTDIHYDSPWGELEAEYSTGNCAESKSVFGYDVAKGFLTRLTFWPNQQLDPASLSFDVAKMKRDMTEDVKGAATYYDNASGVRLGVTKGRVELIEYFPSVTKEQRSCKKLLSTLGHDVVLKVIGPQKLN